MKSTHKISLVIVSFNQRQFLEEAIVSVLSQDYANVELILMDGGSTDGSVDIIKKYESRASFVNIGPDGGATAAMNLGFGKANGDYFAYLNSDDVLLPQACSKWIQAFEDPSRPDVVYGDIKIIDSVGQPSHLPGRRVSTFKAIPFNFRQMAAGGCTIPQQGSCWKREVHERIGGFVEENRSSWDGEFFIDAALAGFSFRHIPEVLGLFRVHGESISGTNKHAEHRRSDHARMRGKWQQRGVRISRMERVFWVKSGQIRRAFRYLTNT